MATPWAKQTVFLLAVFGGSPNEPVVRVPEGTTVNESPVKAEIIWDQGLIHGIKKHDVPLVWPYQETSVAIIGGVLYQDFIFHLCWSRVRQIWSQDSLFRIEGILRGKLNVAKKKQITDHTLWKSAKKYCTSKWYLMPRRFVLEITF